MRFFPIVTALVVMSALFLFVFKREQILDFAGYSDAQSVTEEQPDDASPVVSDDDDGDNLVSVVIQKSMSRTIDSGLIVRGRTEAARQVEVRSETSGKVISEPLRKGTRIEVGQLLCRLDPGSRKAALAEAEARLPEAQSRIPEARARVPEAQARLSEAKSRLVEAEINQRAAQQLSKEGFASETRVASADAAIESALAAVQTATAGVAAAQSGLKAAEAGVQAAEAGIVIARKEIERLAIVAPFAGLLETDTAELGALLQPGAPCATVVQLDPIKLVGFIPETVVAKVRVGSPAGARLATGEQVTGRVTFMSRSADLDTRTFRVEIEVSNTDQSISDGQTAEIVISSDGEAAHLLPLSALTLNDDGEIGVRIINADRIVNFIPITVLRDTVDGIWVNGLPDSVDVIVVGQDYVTEGVKVEVTYRELLQ